MRLISTWRRPFLGVPFSHGVFSHLNASTHSESLTLSWTIATKSSVPSHSIMFLMIECLSTADPSERPVIAESCCTESSEGQEVRAMAKDNLEVEWAEGLRTAELGTFVCVV